MATEADLIQKFKDLNIPVGTDFEELIHEAFVGANLADKVDNYGSRIATVEDNLSATKGSVQSKVTDNKDGTEQLNGVQVQPFNKLSDTVGGRNLYLNSKAIADSYGILGSVTVTVQPFDDTTNMWHIVAKQGANIGIYLYGYANEKMPNSSDWAYSADVKGTAKATWFGIEAGNHKPIVGTIGSEWSRISQTGHFDNAKVKTIDMYFESTDSPVDVYIKLPKLEAGNVATDWSPAPEDKADDNKVVHNSGNEEISGQKTFDTAPIDKTTGNQYITKSDVTTAISAATANMAEDSKVAHLSGINNFTGSIQHNGNSVGAHIQASNNDEDSAINDSTNGNSDDIYYWFED